eukprot:CCRYP_009113-RA/>CCRYP_009113-RA protein AED:0.08 eAED:0.08 QI:160/1/1/1/0.71/0.62/8/1037/466
MRLIVSASILTIACGSAQSSSEHGALETNLEVAKQVDVAYSPVSSEGQRYLGQECKPATETAPDVGVLGCRNPKAFCSDDDASSLGGRCTMDRSLLTPKLDHTIFTNRRLNLAHSNRSPSGRFLQNSGWTCPTNCPEDFCKCAKKNGEVKDCAKQMDDLCLNGLVSECVPYDYLPFYYQTYCPFSECIVANNPYQDCSCQYYRDYCTLYYAFNESTYKCNIAGCCEAAGSVEEKIACLPGLQPTNSPTISPTFSAAPSTSPSSSFPPTISPKPTISPQPTLSPTTSSAPTISIAPTESPTAAPSQSPTVSFAPTKPTENPSLAPTTSFSPTISHSPTDQPTDSSKPTISPKPTFAPSVSIAPTNLPTGSSVRPFVLSMQSPTFSFSPSESPSTAYPTYTPTAKPTRRPTRLPTPRPTRPPADVTEPPTTAAAEDASVDRVVTSSSLMESTFIASLVGLAAAAWFLV